MCSSGFKCCTHVQRENALRVEWCLEWLANKAGVRNRLDRVYEVEALIRELSIHKDGRGPTFHQAKEFLSTTVYDHSIGTRYGITLPLILYFFLMLSSF